MITVTGTFDLFSTATSAIYDLLRITPVDPILWYRPVLASEARPVPVQSSDHAQQQGLEVLRDKHQGHARDDTAREPLVAHGGLSSHFPAHSQH